MVLVSFHVVIPNNRKPAFRLQLMPRLKICPPRLEKVGIVNGYVLSKTESKLLPVEMVEKQLGKTGHLCGE